MIKHIKVLWEDVTEITEYGQFEEAFLNKHICSFEKGILLRRCENLYFAGIDSGDIVIIEHEHQKPIIRISGNFKSDT